MSQVELSEFSEDELKEFKRQVEKELLARDTKLLELLGDSEFITSSVRDDGKFIVTLAVNKNILKRLKRL